LARTLLLDLDGTLVDTVPDIAAALNRLMESRSLAHFTLHEVASMVGDGVAALLAKAFAARGRTHDETALADFSADYGAHVAVASRVYPGVRAVLQDLADDGWILAVCTNKPGHAARDLLAAVDLLELVRAVGGGDSFPVRKPDPAHLLLTLESVGGAVNNAVMLGDHQNDIRAAAGAGLPGIFAAWGYGTLGSGDRCVATAADIWQAAEIAKRLLPP
jgi:phosphoglycolate phosphatase